MQRERFDATIKRELDNGGRTKGRPREVSAREFIRTTVNNSTRPVTVAELRQLLVEKGFSPRTAARMPNHLVADGLIKRVGPGLLPQRVRC